MKKSFLNLMIVSFLTFIFYSQGLCISAKDIVRLKEGGIDGETIQVIIKEKVIETCAFSVHEILKLKNVGMNNKTIQQVIENASFMKDTEPIEYGKDIRSVKFTSVKDIIDLKEAGISDDVIMAIISGTKDVDTEDYNRAWKMLENMGLFIDER